MMRSSNLNKFLCRFNHSNQPLRFPNSDRSFSSIASNSQFYGKTALITGSSSGIGLSIAELLASKGCKVVITGLGDPDIALKRVQSAASEFDKNAIHFIDADLSQRTDAIQLVHDSVEILGDNRLDIVVNNAGLQHVSPIEAFDDDKYELMMNVMLNAPFFITKTVIPYMRRNGYGRIINIASAHGLRASAFKAPYCMAKHGMVGLTKSCALEMAKENHIDWTANAICPGYVKTDLAIQQVHARAKQSGRSYEEEEYGLLSEKNATAKWVEPVDVAGIVEFLCSPHARQITGSTLSVDGGWTAR